MVQSGKEKLEVGEEKSYEQKRSNNKKRYADRYPSIRTHRNYLLA